MPDDDSWLRSDIGRSTPDGIAVRGRDLATELMGQVTFTELAFFLTAARMPSPGETRLFDAALVALADHGLTPSVLAARLTWTGATESLQGAVAAGLLGAGNVFLGVVDDTARLLAAILADAEGHSDDGHGGGGDDGDGDGDGDNDGEGEGDNKGHEHMERHESQVCGGGGTFLRGAGKRGSWSERRRLASAVVLALPATQRARRLAQLLVGLVVFGTGLGLMVRAELGLGPWDVLHQGLSERTGLTIGTAGILVGILVMASWIPLRERPGIGTVVNVVLVGLTMDGTLAVVGKVEGASRWPLLGLSVCMVAAGTALYIGAGLGPGPRDGLMTGYARRFGVSLRAVRTAVELVVLVAGWALGGTVGPGTVVFAFAIGPLLQYGLGRVTIPAPPPAE